MDGLAHRGVVHVQVVRDQPDDHLAAVDPDPDLDGRAVRPAGLVGVLADGLQHRQGGVAGPHGVVLVRDGGAEHRHQAVAHRAG